MNIRTLILHTSFYVLATPMVSVWGQQVDAATDWVALNKPDVPLRSHAGQELIPDLPFYTGSYAQTNEPRRTLYRSDVNSFLDEKPQPQNRKSHHVEIRWQRSIADALESQGPFLTYTNGYRNRRWRSGFGLGANFLLMRGREQEGYYRGGLVAAYKASRFVEIEIHTLLVGVVVADPLGGKRSFSPGLEFGPALNVMTPAKFGLTLGVQPFLMVWAAPGFPSEVVGIRLLGGLKF